MLKMTEELFNRFAEMQEVLDSEIRTKKEIDSDSWLEELHINHTLALKGEVSEFINEAKDLWKYWKSKAVVPDQLIDEAVDIVHFIHLLLNKNVGDHKAYVWFINNRIDSLSVLKRDYRYHLNNMYKADKLEDYLEIYAILLIVLDHYNFTLDDIAQAYKRKNAENFKRQERNY